MGVACIPDQKKAEEKMKKAPAKVQPGRATVASFQSGNIVGKNRFGGG